MKRAADAGEKLTVAFSYQAQAIRGARLRFCGSISSISGLSSSASAFGRFYRLIKGVSGRKLKPDEMNALLREMEATPNSGQCKHGLPTFVELKLADIERLFGRR